MAPRKRQRAAASAKTTELIEAHTTSISNIEQRQQQILDAIQHLSQGATVTNNDDNNSVEQEQFDEQAPSTDEQQPAVKRTKAATADEDEQMYDQDPERLKFESKGNSKQYKMLFELRQQTKAIMASDDQQEIMQLSAELKDAIRFHMKCVRMADESKYGWRKVEFYLRDKLAERANDEGRMRSAESECGKEAVQKERQRAFKQPFRQTGRGQQRGGYGYINRGPQQRQQQYQQQYNRPVVGSKYTKGTGGCYTCGSSQHWARDCTAPSAAAGASTANRMH